MLHHIAWLKKRPRLYHHCLICCVPLCPETRPCEFNVMQVSSKRVEGYIGYTSLPGLFAFPGRVHMVSRQPRTENMPARHIDRLAAPHLPAHSRPSAGPVDSIRVERRFTWMKLNQHIYIYIYLYIYIYIHIIRYRKSATSKFWTGFLQCCWSYHIVPGLYHCTKTLWASP